MDVTHEKYEALKEYLKSLGSVVAAFSGGVDSTFLLKVASNVLGDKVMAVTARSLSFPERELALASEFARQNGIEHIIVDSEELDIEGFSHNPEDRCYLCKSELFSKIRPIAIQKRFAHIIEGSNADDEGDYRPGLQAVAECGIKSPLRYAGLTKDEIRTLSKELGLPTWSKQSFACLSSRFPYGERITPEKLRMIDKAEQYLMDMGLNQIRVRCHGEMARIETDEAGFDVLTRRENRRSVHEKFKEIGFAYVALDLLGYRTGSMNETLAR